MKIIQTNSQKPILWSIVVQSIQKGELSFLNPKNDSLWKGYRDLTGKRLA